MMSDDFRENLLNRELADILGQDKVKKQVRSALLSERHMIIIGEPGVGKTTLAKNIAKLLPDRELADCQFHCDPASPVCPDCRSKKEKGEKITTKKYSGTELFVRIQGSPDLTAEDLIGDIDPVKAIKFGPLSIQAFTPGKIFRANHGVLFFDEVNRCSEKLQNALLQALEEGKVTIGSYTVDFDVNFVFIGTMNPDDASTEPLSDVFLDRFDMVTMGYPGKQELEIKIVRMKGKELLEFPDNLLKASVRFVRDLRRDENVEKKPGVRASLGLYERAQSNAMIEGRKVVEPQDVADAVVSVLSHRIRLKPSIKYLQKPEDYIRKRYEKFSEEITEDGGYL